MKKVMSASARGVIGKCEGMAPKAGLVNRAKVIRRTDGTGA